jgi:hypothetical protein
LEPSVHLLCFFLRQSKRARKKIIGFVSSFRSNLLWIWIVLLVMVFFSPLGFCTSEVKDVSQREMNNSLKMYIN